MKSSSDFDRLLGARLKQVRKRAHLTGKSVCQSLGMKAECHPYVSRLENGKLHDVSFKMLIRYLNACHEPVTEFMVELAQAGAFGEAEQTTGLEVTIQRSEVSTQAEAERRERARTARRNRKQADAAVRGMLRAAVYEAVLPCLKEDWERRQARVYADGADLYYRAWKRIVRGAAGADPLPAINATFDELERLGVSQRLNPEAVHRMREVIFERLSGTGG